MRTENQNLQKKQILVVKSDIINYIYKIGRCMLIKYRVRMGAYKRKLKREERCNSVAVPQL